MLVFNIGFYYIHWDRLRCLHSILACYTIVYIHLFTNHMASVLFFFTWDVLSLTSSTNCERFFCFTEVAQLTWLAQLALLASLAQLAWLALACGSSGALGSV